jgi:hypothetical protein
MRTTTALLLYWYYLLPTTVFGTPLWTSQSSEELVCIPRHIHTRSCSSTCTGTGTSSGGAVEAVLASTSATGTVLVPVVVR